MNKEALSEDIKLRLARIQKVMQAMNIDACVLSTEVNIFYCTGLVYNGYFYLPAEGEAINFVRRPKVNLENTIYIHKPELILESLEERGLKIPKTILVEKDALSFNSISRLQSALKVEQTEDASYLMRRLRADKTDYEVEQIRACARKHEAVYKLIPSLYKRGMSDIELQIEIERQMRLHGSIGIFRSYGESMDIHMGSLLVGENAEAASPFDFALGGAGTSPTLPLGACGQAIKEGQTIMVDMAGNYSPWMTDMTRVFSVGKTSELAYKAHQVSIDIQNRLMQTSKIGTSCAEMYNIALEMVKANNLEPYFMGTDLQAKFVGHGVGLEINEPPVLTPRSKEILTRNTVFALEPKFVIPNVGAVGVENTFVVTEQGLEKITNFEESIIEL